MKKIFSKDDRGVVHYLRNGKTSSLVSQNEIDRYISTIVQNTTDLPIHYKLKIDKILLKKKPTDLIEYLSNALSCATFFVDEKKHVTKGFENLVDHPYAKTLISILQDKNKLKQVIESSFTLYPIAANTSIKIENTVVEEVAFLYTKVGKGVLGFVGPITLDFELSASILKYLGK